MRTSLALLGVATFAFSAPLHAEKADVYALVGGKIVTVSGATHETGTLVMRDGLIEAVGADVAVPRDARRIDIEGMTVTPGLIDAFGGVGIPRPKGSGAGDAPGGRPGASRRGRAAPVTPAKDALDAVKLEAALSARDGGVTTALVVSDKGVVPGRSVLINLSGDDKEDLVLRQPAALHLHMATAGFLDYPGSLMGTLAMARQSLHDAAHYRESRASYEASPSGKKRTRYSAASETWQAVLDGELPLIVTAFRENDVRRALKLRDEFGIGVVVAGAPQAWRTSDLIKEKRLPLLVTVNFDPAKPPSFSFGGGPDTDKESADIEAAKRNPARLHEAGVRFALVSGHASDFAGGVREAIAGGLPSDVALEAVTLRPAELLGIADRTGSLEAGKLANVVVWTGDPFAKGSTAKLVFADGTLHEPEEEKKGKKRSEEDEPGEKAGRKKGKKPAEEVTR